MPIYQALQLSHSGPQFGGGYFNSARGSDQILGHRLIPILERERAALALQQSSQAAVSDTADSLPFTFATLRRQVSRLLSALVG